MVDGFSNVPGFALGGGVWVDRQRLQFGFSRSSGPGGQNVNKVNTKTDLRVHPDDLHGLNVRSRARLIAAVGRRVDAAGAIVLISSNQRTQEANRRACMEKLKLLVSEAMIEPTKRRQTRPTKASRKRRLETKRARSEVKSIRRSPVE
ncbi:MAG: alternative ribosome rescue aminoacyl-tRNA hydrolase ArfB [Planctomycetia bacterium]|nr:alternative ribosome rescue aminoacyl-tRNA hydrolase ArfB [Planctomycetia bacterium]